MAQSDFWAIDVHTFWPDSDQPPSTRTALVDSEARSEPAPGSLNIWHHTIWPSRVGRTKRSCCSAVPWAMIVGSAHAPTARFGRRTRALAAVLGALDGGAEGEGGRRCRRQGGLGADGGHGRVPRGSAGLLDRHQHVGDLVLHGLELPDGPPELLPDLGVGGSGVEAPAGEPGGLSRLQR